jgi:hypothetical protein
MEITKDNYKEHEAHILSEITNVIISHTSNIYNVHHHIV